MEKLNCKSLMIGDWLQYYDCNLQKQCYAQVTSIQADGAEQFIQTSDSDVYYLVEEYKPISLTKEILEKNRFAKGGMFGNMYYLTVGDFEIYVYFAHTNTQLIIEKRNGKEIINILNVKYLHILQHALKLCGIKKEIKL